MLISTHFRYHHSRERQLYSERRLRGVRYVAGRRRLERYPIRCHSGGNRQQQLWLLDRLLTHNWHDLFRYCIDSTVDVSIVYISHYPSGPLSEF